MVTSFRVGIDVGIDAFKRLPGTVALPPVCSTQSMRQPVSQRHEVQSALAFSLLKDIHSTVAVWQEQLRQTVCALHTLHAQGPMVDGWLESSASACQSASQPASHSTTQAAGADSTILRHGDAEALLQYVEALDSACNSANLEAENLEADLKAVGAPTYRLCHLSASGQVVSQPCPAEQMGMVSMAIARYQKFRQLMNKKQAIEAKLQCVVNELTDTRSTLRQQADSGIVAEL